MKFEDIKEGETYNVRVRVLHINNKTHDITTETVDSDGKLTRFEWCYYAEGEACAFSPISTENGIENIEPAPKYDPCRKFRKGDKVRIREWHGRKPKDNTKGKIWEVMYDEDDFVDIKHDSFGRHAKRIISTCYLELVTPVEGIEPYSVHETDYLYRVIQSVDGGEQVVCEYRKNTHPNAKEAAEAECDRLNAEHRKEQK